MSPKATVGSNPTLSAKINEDAPELKYYLAFSLIRGVGRVTLGKIKDHFGSLEEAWSAGAPSFTEAGVEDGVIEEIIKSRPLISPEAEIESWGKMPFKPLPLLMRVTPSS